MTQYYVNRDGTVSDYPRDPVRGSDDDPVLIHEVATLRDRVAELQLQTQELERVEPHEGTNISLWNEGAPIDQFWSELRGDGAFFSPALLERVWVVSRCIQLNAQQIAGMELRYVPGSESAAATEPQWVFNPDPNWYPNGIKDALLAAVADFYGWGDAFLLVTSRYADLMPRTWTVLPASNVTVKNEEGRRVYRLGVDDDPLPPGDVVQISRNPRAGLVRGTSAVASYAGTAWNTVAGVSTTTSMLNNLPPAVLKSQRKLTSDQAQGLQEQWARRASSRGRGVPPVLPPEIDLVSSGLGFSPQDLMLLESQEFDARVLANAFGVPASLLNMAVSGGLTYQNPQTLGEQWWRFELMTTAGRFAAAFSTQMLQRGSAVMFDASATFSPLDTPEEGLAPALPAGASGSPAQRPQLVATGG